VSDAAFMAEIAVDPDTLLYRAMDQPERLQRQRKGETVPPPLQRCFGERKIGFLLPNKAKKCFVFNRIPSKISEGKPL
jgi:hypothetical protein